MPQGKTYVKIASQTAGGSVASITFSNLPQNYTDLVLVVNGGITSGAQDIWVQVNGDTGSNYSRTNLYGTGSAASSTRLSNQTKFGMNDAAALDNTGNFISKIHFMNYSNGSTYKTIIQRADAAGRGTDVNAGLWRNTAPITSIYVYNSGGTNFSSGSTFTIYGIEAAKAPYATGGDKVYSDGTYWYHVFNYSGLFTPTKSLTADYLVLAGGGGGSGGTQGNGGAGGAGGLRCTVTATGGGGSLESALSLTGSTGYTVTVGGGGASHTQGSNSVFSTITSTGGGYGGGDGSKDAGNGGSGGGGSGSSSSPVGAAGTGTANQGYNGAAGVTGGNYNGGGGGGAGAAGSTNGNGGNGVASSITGSSITYAGGGSGSGDASTTPGTGGGGQGRLSNTTTNGGDGTANLGGGGGGASYQTSAGKGGNGGSGIVVVRYAI